MAHQNAILVFSKQPHIARTDNSEPYASLPWGAIDALFSAFAVDVLTQACAVRDADVLFFRNPSDPLDEFLTPLRDNITFGDLTGGTFTEQVQAAVERAFAEGFDRVIALLDNHPTLTASLFERIFAQLKYEDDCVVLGPTAEGKTYLLGLKGHQGELLDTSKVDPLKKQHVLLRRLCGLEAVLFLTEQRYMLDSGFGLARLRAELDSTAPSGAVAARTREVFKSFDKKYRIKYALQ
jgi:glycosyltransferase A (GT-A) superfamily protein (DUF2064 family)